MVTDQQVKLLFKLVHAEPNNEIAAAKAGMNEKTARKYLKTKRLPSEMKKEHNWKTRKDSFEDVGDEVAEMLEKNPGLEGKTIFEYLQRENPGKYADGQLRTLQRRVKVWRALEGASREVFFPQIHYPGVLCQSDFTDMKKLEITIDGQPFPHLIYHFVLTYSNWEAGTICFSENLESLSVGLQNALWELSGVPRIHQTDRLSSAVNNLSEQKEFTQGYNALLKHYKLEGQKTQASHPNENGDVEQRHYRFVTAVDQELMLRGSRDFESREKYNTFLSDLFKRLNLGRRDRLQEEIKILRELPCSRLEAYKRIDRKVGRSSTIHVAHNTYSVHSRLIGEKIIARLHADHLEIWYAQRCVERIPRLRGEGKHKINYRHVIDGLVRKPGAFRNYRYREDLFPSSYFRMAYDAFKERLSKRDADKEYLRTLELAAKENESRVEDAIRLLFKRDRDISFDEVKALIISGEKLPSATEIYIDDVNINRYDELLSEKEEQDEYEAECESTYDRIFEGVAAADSAGMLRGGSTESGSGITQLRIVPDASCPAGGGGEETEKSGTVSEGIEVAVGEEPGDFRSEADDEESDAAGEHAFGGIVFGSERECSGVW